MGGAGSLRKAWRQPPLLVVMGGGEVRTCEDRQTAEPRGAHGTGRAGAVSADAGVGRWLRADPRRWCKSGAEASVSGEAGSGGGAGR